jgi:hypothetical protein
MTKHAKTNPSSLKKNKSAYMFFCAANREVVKSECSDLNNKEIISELASRWKLAKENNEIDKYNELALQDKERYTREKNSSKNVVETKTDDNDSEKEEEVVNEEGDDEIKVKKEKVKEKKEKVKEKKEKVKEKVKEKKEKKEKKER